MKIKIVTTEDVSKQMIFQECVDRRSKFKDRPTDRSTNQARLNFSSKVKSAPVGRQRACFIANFVLDGFLPPFIQNCHKNSEAVKASRKSHVRIQLNNDFLDFIDAQTGIRPSY